MFFSYGLAGDCDIRVHGFQNSKSVSDFENAIANRKNGWIIWKSLDVLEFAKDVSDFENSSMFGKRYLNNRNISRIDGIDLNNRNISAKSKRFGISKIAQYFQKYISGFQVSLVVNRINSEDSKMIEYCD
jgi:hypothetical protein